MLTAPLRPLRRGAPARARTPRRDARTAAAAGLAALFRGNFPWGGRADVRAELRGGAGPPLARPRRARPARHRHRQIPRGTGRPRSGTAAAPGGQAQVCPPILPCPVAKSTKRKVQLLRFQSRADSPRACFLPYLHPCRASLRHPRSVSLERPSALLFHLFLGCMEPGDQPRERKSPGRLYCSLPAPT